jgi:arsenate reductase (thioredoxin)
MKFFAKSKNSEHKEKNKTVLFVCVENAGRSQMAEGFFKKYAPRGYGTLSAGTRRSSEINPLAIQVMNEFDIDISEQKPKDLTEDMIIQSDVKVNMGCMEKESCPTLFIHNVKDWDIEDPKGKSIEKVREIRDVIEQKVRRLAADLVEDKPEINF